MLIKRTFPEFWKKVTFVSLFLLPFSALYFLLTKLRHLLAKEIHLAPVKTICVGNYIVGGSGKTQVVIWLANKLREQNIKFAIITKGYGSGLTRPTLVQKNISRTKDVGDESLLLADYGTVIATKNVKSARSLINSLDITVAIVDDGLQNPYFHKDIKILVVDTKRKHNNFLIPAGPLRQSKKSALSMCDIVIKIDENYDNLSPEFIYFDTVFDRVEEYDLASQISIRKDKLEGNFFAFASIGNPEKFFEYIKSMGVSVCATKSFPDHHNYQETELLKLEKQASQDNLILITTSKDIVKIKEIKSSHQIKINALYVRIETKEEKTILDKIF